MAKQHSTFDLAARCWISQSAESMCTFQYLDGSPNNLTLLFKEATDRGVAMGLTLRLICFFWGLIVLVGCAGNDDGPLISDLVVIKYRQVYNFSEWKLQTNTGETFLEGKNGDGIYMRYRIESINNSSNPKIFRFDPAKVYASDFKEKPVKNSEVPNLEVMFAFDVIPHSIFKKPGNLTIKAKGSLAEIGNQIQFLHYASSAGEHVLMVAEDPKVTSVEFRNPLLLPAKDAN